LSQSFRESVENPSICCKSPLAKWIWWQKNNPEILSDAFTVSTSIFEFDRIWNCNRKHLVLNFGWPQICLDFPVEHSLEKISFINYSAVKSLLHSFSWVWQIGPEQGCQIFHSATYQKRGKIHQMTTKYTIWPYSIPKCHKKVSIW
jgi:hypothetical protein